VTGKVPAKRVRRGKQDPDAGTRRGNEQHCAVWHGELREGAQHV